MNRERRRRIEELFQVALDLPEAERRGYLQETEPDASIRSEVLALIGHHDAGRELFTFESAMPRPLPKNIGPFEIESQLGEGGMGVVYLARQTSPVRRTVALKVVRSTASSEESLRRFDAEREALAQLEHPNIARFYEAGQTEDGLPYFAMEYVDGLPITKYCDGKRLTSDERVELLTHACAGVEAAHQKGIIHRDLKPTNILVAEEDGRAVPKIIDFGVAKALETRDEMATQFTRFGQLLGTPEYMSPEQASGQPVDTRSDVYSLGVVLYELLAGVLPLDASSIREEGFEAMMRLIRESEPSRPSTRVSTLGAEASTMAERRRTSPRELARSLRGELDWIALRALEKERDRRYAAVSDLMADLRAHLEHEPVRARPATFAYQLRKFARRNRLAVGLATAAMVTLVLVAVTTTFQAGRIVQERDRANREAAVAEEVKAFLVDLFEGAEPSVARGDTLTAFDLLHEGLEQIDEVEDPRVRAELLGTLSDVQHSLGDPQTSLRLYRRAYDTFVELDGAVSTTALGELNNVGNAYFALGDYAAAESLYTECLEGWKRLGNLESSPAVDAVQNLASVQMNLGHYDEAEAGLLEAARLRERIMGEDDPKLFLIRDVLAQVYHRQERHDEELAVVERLLEDQRETFGPNHPDVVLTMAQLARAYTETDRGDEAEALLEQAVALGQRVLGESHPRFQRVQEQLAYLYYHREQYAEAEPYFVALVDSARSQRGPEHPNTLTALHNLGALYGQWGRQDRAKEVLREVLELRLRLLGDEHPKTQGTRFNLALIAAKQGDLETALEQLRIAIDSGFNYRGFLEVDEGSDFAGLFGDPEFERLRELIRERLGEN